MCGICGSVWTGAGQALSEADLERMTASLTHRGPDDSGTYRDSRCALGFRRLAIVDLAGAHQPLANESGTIQTVFNGEIYNFKALRHRLEAKGHTLESAGDTEVLVHLYEDEGEGMFPLLRGMFALAIWDAPKRKLILARDRLGQKPLFYSRLAHSITFASELKALASLRDAPIARAINPIALDRYLTYGYINHPHSIYQSVHKLPPAHYAVWTEGRFTMERYWNPDLTAESTESLEAHAERLRGLVDESVCEQMVADVPIGAFLSGGIDSTIITALMQRHASGKVKTFSIGFDDPAFDESAYAELAAERIGTEHHAFVIEPRAWETIPAIAAQFDEPFADSSALPTWHVARETRAHVTVALTGDAGDELFGGYDRYRALALAELVDRLPKSLRTGLAGPFARRIPASVQAKTRLRKARRWLEALGQRPLDRYLQWITLYDESARTDLYTEDWLETLAAAGDADLKNADPRSMLAAAWEGFDRDPPTRAMIADLLTYLPGDLLVKVDLASMAHSLECRAPFLDHRVVELAMRIPSDQKLRIREGRSKVVLKRAFHDLLPREIARRPKMGFGVPIDRWFRGPLAGELSSILLDAGAGCLAFFRRETIERLVREHADSISDHAYKLWALLMFEHWLRRFGGP